MFGEFYRKLYDDESDDGTRTEVESDEKKNEGTQTVQDESLKKCFFSQRKRYMTPSIVSNAAILVTAMESELKTSKL